MILLITHSSCSQRCAPAIEAVCRRPVHSCETLSDAVRHLRGTEVDLLVIDETVLNASPRTEEAVLENAGGAGIVILNFALTSAPRVAREAKAALRRVLADRERAVTAVAAALRGDIGTEVTGLMLATELALNSTNVPPELRPRLQVITKLARHLASKLSSASDLGARQHCATV